MDKLSPEEKRNYMYHQLVGQTDDVVGMIAYCKYKAAKIEYIVSFTKEKNRKPKDEELVDFQRKQTGPTTIAGYRDSALRSFEAVIAATLEKPFYKENEELKGKLASLEKRCEEYEARKKELKRKEDQTNKIANICPAQKRVGGFWMSVLASGVATLLLSGAYIVLWIYNGSPSLRDLIVKTIQ